MVAMFESGRNEENRIRLPTNCFRSKNSAVGPAYSQGLVDLAAGEGREDVHRDQAELEVVVDFLQERREQLLRRLG